MWLLCIGYTPKRRKMCSICMLCCASPMYRLLHIQHCRDSLEIGDDTGSRDKTPFWIRWHTSAMCLKAAVTDCCFVSLCFVQMAAGGNWKSSALTRVSDRRVKQPKIFCKLCHWRKISSVHFRFRPGCLLGTVGLFLVESVVFFNHRKSKLQTNKQKGSSSFSLCKSNGIFELFVKVHVSASFNT